MCEVRSGVSIAIFSTGEVGSLCKINAMAGADDDLPAIYEIVAIEQVESRESVLKHGGAPR